MAWGCFSWIPCPYKKWNEDDRTAMVATLPLVGTGLGLVTTLVWLVLNRFGASGLMEGAVITGAYFVMTGFIHLDGFMDVCDAVMPRHPRMEERRRILKDPHTGSFAAVSMVLMMLIFGASATHLSEIVPAACLIFTAVVTSSRCCSAMAVILSRPMETSQYATTDFGRDHSLAKAVPALIITILVVGLCFMVCLFGLPGLYGPAGQMAAAGVLVASGVCAATALIMGALDRRSLGGMNGDISGHMITSGEMAGLLAAALILG